MWICFLVSINEQNANVQYRKNDPAHHCNKYFRLDIKLIHLKFQKFLPNDEKEKQFNPIYNEKHKLITDKFPFTELIVIFVVNIFLHFLYLISLARVNSENWDQYE